MKTSVMAPKQGDSFQFLLNLSYVLYFLCDHFKCNVLLLFFLCFYPHPLFWVRIYYLYYFPRLAVTNYHRLGAKTIAPHVFLTVLEA